MGQSNFVRVAPCPHLPPLNSRLSWRPRSPAALAGQVQELGPVSEETAAETQCLATTLETLSQQQDLINQFEASGRALNQQEQAMALSRSRLTELRREQQGTAGSARQLTDSERLLASEVKQLGRQLVAQSASHTRLQRELHEIAVQTKHLGRSLQQSGQHSNGFHRTRRQPDLPPGGLDHALLQSGHCAQGKPPARW